MSERHFADPVRLYCASCGTTLTLSWPQIRGMGWGHRFVCACGKGWWEYRLSEHSDGTVSE